MSDFNLWSGDVRIIKVDPNNPPAKADFSKFLTCQHRSAEEEVRTHKSCCSTYSVKGFVCHRRGIFALTPDICVTCEVYEPKPQIPT